MNLENLKPGDLIQAEWQEKFVIPSKNYHMLEKSWLRISERRVTEPRNIVYYMASYFPEDNDGVRLPLEKPFLFFKSNGWIPGCNFVTAKRPRPEEFSTKSELPDI